MTAQPTEQARLGRLLFADLAGSVDRAFEAARAASGDAAGVADRATSVDALIDAAAATARDGDFGRAAFSGIDGQEAARLKAGFENAKRVASWGGLRVPDPEEFWAAGADQAKLSRALMADPNLAVVPTVYGLGANGWTSLYRAAARTATSPLSLVAPIVLAPEVAGEFELLDQPPHGTPFVVVKDLRWTLRLVPAAETPSLIGLSHAHGPHPTLPELLMLQLGLVAASEPLIDTRSLTWASGTLSGGKFAARVLFDETERSVRVNTRETGNQGPHLGARPPIG